MRLLWWTPAVLVLSLFSVLLSESGTLDPFQNLTLTVSAPIETGVADLARPTSDFFDGVFDRGDIVRENERLRQEVESLKAQLAGSEEARRRLKELEEALNIRESRPDDELLVADVIAQDPSGVKRALAINRGRSDGLDEGMVVLSKSGSLVGTVSQVFDDFAWLRLLSDPNSAVNVSVLPSSEDKGEARGVAVGELRSSLSLDLLPADAQVAEGDLVTTSGLGGNYPPGLLVGSIAAVEEQPQSLTKRARIEPSAELASVETVLVIANFLPARLTGP
jgi:rod shape-determining protein MreC